MFESAVIYIGLMVVMMIFAWLGSRSDHRALSWAALSAISFAIVMAVRWKVGVDFYMYYKQYELVKAGSMGFGFQRYEPLFRLLFYVCGTNFLHYSIPFGIIAFLQCFLIFVGLRAQKRAWIFIPFTLMMTGLFVSYDNIMRHMMAFSIFICAIPYLAKRKYWQYLLCIIGAMMFHKSAAVLLFFPLIYMFCKQIFSRIWVQLIFVGIGLAMMNLDNVQDIFEAISFALTLLGYEFYMTTSFAEFDEETKIGLGFMVILLCNLILVLFSRKTKEFYDSRAVAIMYDMYFVGFFIKLAFMRMFLLQRLNYYFFSFEFIIAALTMWMFYKKKNWIMLLGLCAIYIVLFFGKLSNTEVGAMTYHTFWE